MRRVIHSIGRRPFGECSRTVLVKGVNGSKQETAEELHLRHETCDVIRIPRFLSDAEIMQVFSVEHEYHEAFTPPIQSQPYWVTTYLSTKTQESPKGLFRGFQPALFDKVSQLRKMVDARCSTLAELEKLEVRCIELHAYGPGGGLKDRKHFDGGSVVTVDLMLDDEFTGGQFQTPVGTGDDVKSHVFNKGDALIFPSGKYHMVDKITGGARKVMIVEFWNGPERHCDHRCHQNLGECGYIRLDDKPVNPPLENCYYD